MEDRAAYRLGLGARIRAARARAGVSHLDLAERIGVSRPALSGIEAGRQALAVDVLVTIAEVLDVDVADLVRDRPLQGTFPGIRGLLDEQRAWIETLKRRTAEGDTNGKTEVRAGEARGRKGPGGERGHRPGPDRSQKNR